MGILGGIQVLVDGLDEIEESSRSDVFQLFARLCRPDYSKSSAPNVKIIVTHHPGRFPLLANQFPASFQIIHIDQQMAVYRDVRKYIDSEVLGLSVTLDLPRDVVNMAKAKLMEKSQETFLWVALALRSLQDARQDNIIDRITDLPPGLDAMYERILRQIPTGDRTAAALALHCVVADLPLSTDITLGAMLACLQTPKSREIPSVSRIRQLRTAWRAAEVLLRVEGWHNYLRTIHQSVEHFFRMRSLPEDLSMFRYDRSEFLNRVKNICQDYLYRTNLLHGIKDLVHHSQVVALPSAQWDTFNAFEHVEFLRFSRRNGGSSEPSFEWRTMLTSHRALMLRSERQAFWQGVWRVSQQPSLAGQKHLFDLIERAAPQLSDIAIATKQVGIVRVINVALPFWWVVYFGPIATAESHWMNIQNPTLDGDDPKLKVLVHVLVDAILLGSLEFAFALVRVVPNSEEVCAFVIRELVGLRQGYRALQFIKITEPLVVSAKYPTYLHLLAEFNIADVIRLLLDGQYAFQTEGMCGNTPLHVAAMADSLESLKVLLEASPLDLYSRDAAGESPVFTAAANDSLQSLQCLIDTGGLIKNEAQVIDRKGRSPSSVAAKTGSHDALKVLLKAQPTIMNAQSNMGRTALHLACQSGHAACVRTLRDAGADPFIKDRQHNTAVHMAMWGDDIKKVQAVLDALDTRLTRELIQADSAKETLLMGAARHGLLEYVQDCIAMGATLENVDGHGRSALHHAAMNGHSALVQALLTASSHQEILGIRDDYPREIWQHYQVVGWEQHQQTALHHAVYAAHPEIVKILIAADASGEFLRIKNSASQLSIDLARKMQDLDAETTKCELSESWSWGTYQLPDADFWNPDRWKDVWRGLGRRYQEILVILEDAHSRLNAGT